MAASKEGGRPATVFRVGDLKVDVAQARLWQDGREVVLPRLSFDLLVALAEAAPAIASTGALLGRVWPGLVVNDETVTQRVKLLRAALGDEPRAPRYVQVVRSRGYRLLPEVRWGEEPTQDTGVVASPPVPATGVTPGLALPANPPPRSRHWLAVAAALLLAGLAGWWVQARREAGPPALATAAAERSIAVLPFQNLGTVPEDRALALGVAESVLHQLANREDLVVIARSSSFALGEAPQDARRIGERLGARYLLEGSVQRADTRLRVTAQLVDAASGAQLWSLQFERGTRDVFAVQDEIAAKVAQALELGIDAGQGARLAGPAPANFDAYFEFLQARALLVNDRVADLPAARGYLERAIRLDGEFADAMVDLAGVELRLAEFDHGADRGQGMAAATQRASALIERALTLDPRNGRAWLQRANLLSFADPEGAEQDYRKGLALAPNEASGHAGLAAVLYQDPARHDEALVELERARRLDPINPNYDVTRAVFLLYGRGDLPGARAILQRVVQQHPQYAPGLARLGELELIDDHIAEGVRFTELALALDPQAEFVRRLLVTAYLDVGDITAATGVMRQGPGRLPVRELPLQLLRGAWREAGENAYQALRAGTTLAYDENFVALALRRHARVTGERQDALATLEQLAGVSWNTDGDPVVVDNLDMMSALVGAADLLLLDGQREQGRRLLRAMLAELDRPAREPGRSVLWRGLSRAQALALLGDADGAIAQLQAKFTSGKLVTKHWLYIGLDPAFDSLRGRADFRAIQAGVEEGIRRQRTALEQLRREGLVPQRG